MGLPKGFLTPYHKLGVTNDHGQSLGANCKKCDENQLCDECQDEVRARTLAVRLLSNSVRPDDMYFELSQQWYASDDDGQASIESELARRIHAKTAAIPAVLPAKPRNDTKEPKIGEAVARAHKSGRRKTKEFRRTAWS